MFKYTANGLYNSVTESKKTQGSTSRAHLGLARVCDEQAYHAELTRREEAETERLTASTRRQADKLDREAKKIEEHFLKLEREAEREQKRLYKLAEMASRAASPLVTRKRRQLDSPAPRPSKVSQQLIPSSPTGSIALLASTVLETPNDLGQWGAYLNSAYTTPSTPEL